MSTDKVWETTENSDAGGDHSDITHCRISDDDGDGGNNLKYGVVTPGGEMMALKIVNNANFDYSNRGDDKYDNSSSSARSAH